MTLEKRIIEVEEFTAPWEEPIIKQKQIYVETKTITEEVVRHKDLLESMIAQKENTIENLQNEVLELKAKQTQIQSLSKK